VVVDLGPYFGPETFPIQTLPGFADLVGYFNIDNGSGKIRGIYTEGNLAVVSLFKEWLAPFASMGGAPVVAKPSTAAQPATPEWRCIARALIRRPGGQFGLTHLTRRGMRSEAVVTGPIAKQDYSARCASPYGAAPKGRSRRSTA
jgi:hypothetical protein